MLSRVKQNNRFKIYFILLLTFLIAFFIPLNTIAEEKLPTPNKKVVYLTFDDGPTPIITPKLLDVLREQKVKSTFFVVGKEIDGRENILKRIHEEGHGIGLHTYSHSFKKIYSSNDTFVQEMLDTQKKVKTVTGVETNILRFPGGSYKRLSKSFLDKLHKNNFKIYDWNVCLEDAIKPHRSVNALIKNAKKFDKKDSRLIVLMHCNCNNQNTIKALPTIIKYYRDLGYEFDIISNDTEEYFYKIKK